MGRFDFAPTSLNLVTTLCDASGLLFPHGCFRHLPPGAGLPYHAFCTGNLSVPTESVRRVGGFDEDFPWPVVADVELGYRLSSGGLRLTYAPRLRCLHHHTFDLASLRDRFRRYGHEWVRFALKHPDWDPLEALPLIWRGDEWPAFALAHPVAAATRDPALLREILRPSPRLAADIRVRLDWLADTERAAREEMSAVAERWDTPCLEEPDSVRAELEANGVGWTERLCQIARCSWLRGVLTGVERLLPADGAQTDGAATATPGSRVRV